MGEPVHDGYIVSIEVWGVKMFKRVHDEPEMLNLVSLLTSNGACCTVEPFWNAQ